MDSDAGVRTLRDSLVVDLKEADRAHRAAAYSVVGQAHKAAAEACHRAAAHAARSGFRLCAVEYDRLGGRGRCLGR